MQVKGMSAFSRPQGMWSHNKHNFAYMVSCQYVHGIRVCFSGRPYCKLGKFSECEAGRDAQGNECRVQQATMVLDIAFHLRHCVHSYRPYLIIPISHSMEKVLVAPSQVLSYPGHIRVSIGAVEDVIIGVPSQIPVPDNWIEAMTCTELVVLLNDLLHEQLWGGACILKQLPMDPSRSLQLVNFR